MAIPSDDFTIGSLGGIDMVFLPRHGKGHRLTPSELPFRANIWAMKSLGVERIDIGLGGRIAEGRYRAGPRCYY